MLVVYTAAAKWSAGGAAEIAALIDLSVAETNRAYAASNVIQRIRLERAGASPWGGSASNFCPPEQDDRFVINTDRTVYLAGCVPGTSAVHLVRDVDGEILRPTPSP